MDFSEYRPMIHKNCPPFDSCESSSRCNPHSSNSSLSSPSLSASSSTNGLFWAQKTQVTNMILQTTANFKIVTKEIQTKTTANLWPICKSLTYIVLLWTFPLQNLIFGNTLDSLQLNSIKFGQDSCDYSS